MKILLLLSASLQVFNIVVESAKLNTFVVSFQSDQSTTIDHWMRYKGQITGIEKEFTCCHWEKVRFFSLEFNSVWAYCFISPEIEVKLPCIQFYHYRNTESAGRNFDLALFGSQNPPNNCG